MPGIAGAIGPGGQWCFVEQMTKCLHHEEFHDSGGLALERAGVLLGWTTLKDSYCDCLPIWNDARDRCLVFFGEHFGEQVESGRTDARRLIDLYEQEGMRFFELLDGSFCGVLVDLREGRSILFNDRYGIGRVYVYEARDCLLFSSEAKSLLKIEPNLRSFDSRSLAEYFWCGSPLQNRSLFSGISLLPAGALWIFESGRSVRKQRYFDLSRWQEQEVLSPAEYCEKLKETCQRVLPRYFSGDREISLALTSGLDSRMIISMLNPNVKFGCHTFSGMHRRCLDAKIGGRIAKMCGRRHQLVEIDREFFREFPTLARQVIAYTNGALDVSGAAGLYAIRRARQIAPIRMTGNYGSEILRRNIALHGGHMPDALFTEGFLRGAAKTLSSEQQVPPLSFIVSKQLPWFHVARYALESSQMTVRSPFLDNELVQLSFQAPTEPDVRESLIWRLVSDHSPVLDDIPTDRGHAPRSRSMKRFLWRYSTGIWCKAEELYDFADWRWFARVDRVLSPLRIERAFIGTQKFCHFRGWFRNELAPFMKEVLLDPRSLTRSYVNGAAAEAAVRAHIAGISNHTHAICRLLSIELAQRALFDDI